MLTLKGVRRAFGRIEVLRGVDLTVLPGEIIVLLGASGSGKSTLLYSIAGLEPIDAGEIAFDGQSLSGVPAHARDFGLMFQDFALFPHLDVAGNVAFGLKGRGSARDAIAGRVTEMLALVGLEGFEKRSVAQLSGGEQQRVALARSLAPRPRLLMLDEPLGALDAGLRARLVGDLRTVIKTMGVMGLYVTHDQAEAFAVADRIAIMHDGCIEAVDTPVQLYFNPQTVYTAQFLGLSNILPVLSRAGDTVETALGVFHVQSKESIDALLVHPDHIRLATDEADSADSLEAVIGEVQFEGVETRMTAQIGGVSLRFSMPSRQTQSIHAGDTVRLLIARDGAGLRK